MDSSKNGRCIIPFKEFSRLRINFLLIKIVLFLGSYFQVVPNSPDGNEIKQFKIERKDDDRPFKWDIYSKFYFIPSASELDAGLYMWKMVLDNNEEYSGCFEITIFFPGKISFFSFL